MKLSVATQAGDLFHFEVSDDIEVENFKAYCEVESGVSASDITLLFEGKPLSEAKKALKDYGVRDGDVLLMDRKAPTPLSLDFSSIRVPSHSQQYHDSVPAQARSERDPVTIPGLPADVATLREMLLNSPHELSLLKERNPRLAEALLSGNLDRFSEVLRQQQQEKAKRDQERTQMLMADPFDPEVQRKIAEEIRMENVNANMETAMEFTPESFGQVHMLYIDCRVNGHDVKSFVDSGAQMTIMSLDCARRCHIERLIDTRWAGIAKGVGTQRIIGRVHMCSIQVGRDFLPCNFAILEDQAMDMLLGLDMLKRHQCCIDLKNNLLTIGTTGTSTSFLSEGELPAVARLNYSPGGSEGFSPGRPDEHHLLAEANARTGAAAGGIRTLEGGPPRSVTRGSRTEYDETAIQTIVANGFTREQAITELSQADGDVEKALMALLARSLAPPSAAPRR